jgi:hypothetical protein
MIAGLIAFEMSVGKILNTIGIGHQAHRAKEVVTRVLAVELSSAVEAEVAADAVRVRGRALAAGLGRQKGSTALLTSEADVDRRARIAWSPHGFARKRANEKTLQKIRLEGQACVLIALPRDIPADFPARSELRWCADRLAPASRARSRRCPVLSECCSHTKSSHAQAYAPRLKLQRDHSRRKKAGTHLRSGRWCQRRALRASSCREWRTWQRVLFL